MIEPFEFLSAGRVVFGNGCFSRAAEIGLRLGKRAFAVTGRSALEGGRKNEPAGAARAVEPGELRRGARGATEPEPSEPHWPRQIARPPSELQSLSAGKDDDAGAPSPSSFARLSADLARAGISVVRFLVRGEPTTDVVDEGARLALAAGCEFVIGLGGGSVLDASKAISGLMTNGGEALDYVEVVGQGRPIESPSAPWIAIPTTAGTGTEVTKNAVLTEPRARVKVSMRSPHLLPVAALVDPELTFSLPSPLTAATGLDALTQLLEAYTTRRANPLTDLLALDGIARSARSLMSAVSRPADPGPREDLALASLYGGLALANAGLGAVHGIAAPLGGRHPVPHGIACAVILPHILAANVQALRRSDPDGPALARIRRAAETLVRCYRSGDGRGIEDRFDDPAQAAVGLLRRIVSECRLPGLAAFGVDRAAIAPIVEGALRASSMKGNPVALSAEELGAAIAAAL